MDRIVILGLLFASSGCSALAHVVFKKISALGWLGLLSWYGLLAIALYGIGFLLYFFSLKHIELSIAGQFIITTYVMVCLGSYFIFNETISAKQIAGMAGIAIGLFTVLRG